MKDFDIYLMRLNRYGNDYKTRTQNKREIEFDLYLKKSIYRVDFEYNGEDIEATLERYKQDETATYQYLLTRRNVELPPGAQLEISGNRWLVYYKEQIEASGYNKYILLKLSHLINWTARDGEECEAWAYLYGQEDNMLKNEIRSRSRMDVIYSENLKTSFFILPFNDKIKRDDYLEVKIETITEGYVVTGYDVLSSPGIEYVTIDPVPLRDHSLAPSKDEDDFSNDFFWLNGGE